MHINKIHKTDGVNFVNPSEILAKLFDAIPTGAYALIMYITGFVFVYLLKNKV